MTYIKLNNINVYYKKEGIGIPLIFLHGLSDSSDFWTPLINHFSDEYQILIPDLRGHGSSSKDVDINIKLLTQDLNEFVDALGIQRFHLIGFSLGALIALNYSLEFSDKIKSITLCSGYCKATTEVNANFKYVERLTERGGMGAFFDEMIKRIYTLEFLSRHVEYFNYRKTAIEMNSKQAIIQSLKVCEKFDVKNRLAEIEFPSLILCGTDDYLISSDCSVDLNDNIKDSTLIQFNGVGHNIFLPEQLSKIISEIKSFIELK
jgi:3-oxoadipate enol-lactonase